MAHALAFAECAFRAQKWLSTYSANELAMFIAEDAGKVRRFIKKIHTLLRDQDSEFFRLPGVELEPLSNVIDTIHFAEKNETSILQLADLSAFLMKRYFMERPVERFLRPMLPNILWSVDRARLMRAAGDVSS